MSRISQASSISGRSIKSRTKVNIGIVLDVITNDEHPAIVAGPSGYLVWSRLTN